MRENRVLENSSDWSQPFVGPKSPLMGQYLDGCVTAAESFLGHVLMPYFALGTHKLSPLLSQLLE